MSVEKPFVERPHNHCLKKVTLPYQKTIWVSEAEARTGQLSAHTLLGISVGRTFVRSPERPVEMEIEVV